MIVEHRTDEHNIPENLKCCDGDEHQLDHRCVLLVENLKLLQVCIVEISQWIRCIILLIAPAVFFGAKVISDAVPIHNWSARERMSQVKYLFENILTA